MGAVIPLSDATRRPRRFPFVTVFIIVVNVLVFMRELMGGEAFVLQWAAVPVDLVAGHRWITLLTAMFMHGSWSHIVGNMVFFWAFGPEIEGAMNPLRYLAFYLVGGLISMLAQVASSPGSSSSQSGRERRNCRRDGRISRHLSPRSNSLTAVYFGFCARHLYTCGPVDRGMVSDSTF